MSSPVAKRKIKLASNHQEREMYENYAELYSIIKTVEYLEKAYVRDSCTAEEYTPACSQLISQFKTAKSFMGPSFDLNQFLSDYRLNCTAAIDRLTRVGVPATVEHKTFRPGVDARSVAEAVQYFITAMDSLKLDMKAVDQLQPLLVDLLSNLNAIPSMNEFDGKEKIVAWLTILNGMDASDELNSNQVRQMLFDLETAYNAFYKSLSN